MEQIVDLLGMRVASPLVAVVLLDSQDFVDIVMEAVVDRPIVKRFLVVGRLVVQVELFVVDFQVVRNFRDRHWELHNRNQWEAVVDPQMLVRDTAQVGLVLLLVDHTFVVEVVSLADLVLVDNLLAMVLDVAMRLSRQPLVVVDRLLMMLGAFHRDDSLEYLEDNLDLVDHKVALPLGIRFEADKAVLVVDSLDSDRVVDRFLYMAVVVVVAAAVEVVLRVFVEVDLEHYLGVVLMQDHDMEHHLLAVD